MSRAVILCFLSALLESGAMAQGISYVTRPTPTQEKQAQAHRFFEAAGLNLTGGGTAAGTAGPMTGNATVRQAVPLALTRPQLGSVPPKALVTAPVVRPLAKPLTPLPVVKAPVPAARALAAGAVQPYRTNVSVVRPPRPSTATHHVIRQTQPQAVP